MITNFKDPENRYLSNFHLVDIEYDGAVYPSSEHAYMSAKSNDAGWKEFCQDRKNSCGVVKKQSYSITLVENWDQLKFKVMYDVLKLKFVKGSLLADKLLSTGNQNLQEGNWHNDRIWGVDLKTNPNIGENHLGRTLMRIRDELRNG